MRPEGAKDATDAEATSSPESTDDAAATTQAPADTQDAPLDAADTRIERLALFGTPHGPDEREALALLAALRESLLEFDALAAPLRSPAATARRRHRRGGGQGRRRSRRDRHRAPTPRRRLEPDRVSSSRPTWPKNRASRPWRLRWWSESSRAPTRRRARAKGTLARPRDWSDAQRARLARSASRDETALSAHVDAPYVLRREIARGGAATVYEADDRTLERRVALKVYHDAREDREQLLGEARTATTLAGPRIIRISDADPESG
ncbi:MAG: hypothetical protein U0235_16255 [Polyangiaceae bacterium]